MTARIKSQIKSFFQTGDKPTEAEFIDLVDSYVDKSGPIGALETITSGAPTGYPYFSGGVPSIHDPAQVLATNGIEVYTSAQVQSIVGGGIGPAILARIATTAAATAATDTSALMTPFLTRRSTVDYISGVTATTAQATAAVAGGVFMTPVLTRILVGDNQTQTGKGYKRFPGGFTVQWGPFSAGTIEYAIPFTTTCCAVIGQVYINDSVTSYVNNINPTPTVSAFTWNNGVGAGRWVAIGY